MSPRNLVAIFRVWCLFAGIGLAGAAIAGARGGASVDWSFPDIRVQEAECNASTGAAVRALLVGIDEYDRHTNMSLRSAANDARLLSSTLARRGVNSNEIALLAGRVGYEELAKKAAELLHATRCGDYVFVHFSGHGDKSSADIFTSETEFGLRNKVLSRKNLIEFVRALRKRGANVWLSVDTFGSNSLEIAGALSQAYWRRGRSNDLHPGALGSFTGFYAGSSVEMRFPQGNGEHRYHGAFTYALATALSDERAELTPRQLAERVEQTHAAFFKKPGRSADEVFESTVPDEPILRLRSNDKPRGALARIELAEPAAMRGATLVATGRLRVAGRVIAAQPVIAVMVNTEVAKFTPDGRFSIDVDVREGKQRIFVTAVLQRGEIVSDSIEVIHQPGRQSTLKGRRYALLIANQNYADARYDRLQTPAADVDALAHLLRERFGFVTELAEEGKPRSLILKEATGRQILGTINRLRHALKEEDSLLIYYAGHGWKNDRLEQAYWLPVDAEYEDLSSWISAQQVSDQLKLMNARHVLVVSDSCYSGGMFRGNEAERPSGANELAVIAQLENRRSRLVITSGSNEPVADGGGGGHSVFARALIDALGAVADKPIASETLFSQSVRMGVLGYSRQAPQIKPVANTGHDGGDFVFWPLKARQ